MSTSRGQILVCGGAGYIGSHLCKRLAREGFQPVVFDNLSTGHRWAVKWGPLIEGDLLDPVALAEVFANHRIQAVLHFAAKSLVAESMREPSLYMRNNVVGTLNLIDAMRQAGVHRLVFSSTAAVYGNPEYTPIDEAHPTRPINPYGWSKLMAEQVIRQACHAEGLRAVCLRYFNAAGADAEGEIGEAHDPETHLIPNLIKAALDPALGVATIFGNDYPTPDGTCIRDYIHVEDLAEAHLSALRLTEDAGGCEVFNLGSGVGYSVAEVLGECQRQCGGLPRADMQPRRPGDPARLVANVERARDGLAFNARKDMTSTVASARAWHLNLAGVMIDGRP